MALYPKDFMSQDKLQPGARGEMFGADIPGYRNQGSDRINRTNNNLNTSAHDVPNIKYMLDSRLPKLFRFGFAYGYNQVVIPKGRLVALDPNMSIVDFEDKKAYNAITLANGGNQVKLKTSGDTTAWELDASTYLIDPTTGKVVVGSTLYNSKRAGNVPIGVMFRNEYTRDEDAFNGIMPGAVLTDCMLELPWFSTQAKAEANVWGSAYGDLKPGELVKSDLNGRFVRSPLNDLSVDNLSLTYTPLQAGTAQAGGATTITLAATASTSDDAYNTKFINIVGGTGAGQVRVISDYVGLTQVATVTTWDTNPDDTSIYRIDGYEYPYNPTKFEKERQQVIGQVYETSKDLVPAGAAIYAQWALSDRLNFEDMNPNEWAQNNRSGEDAIAQSPFNSEGTYPGYPYEKGYLANDLHMLASTRGIYEKRMQEEYMLTRGIPGLTDGHNAVKTLVLNQNMGTVKSGLAQGDKVLFRTLDTAVEDLFITGASNTTTIATPSVLGDTLATATKFDISYIDLTQGVIELTANDAISSDTIIYCNYNKRGMAGVPTFMDWDGVVGRVKVLLQK